jgi:hypothetical protein
MLGLNDLGPVIAHEIEQMCKGFLL